LIVEDIDKALADGRRCLVLSHWKEHCDKLALGVSDKFPRRVIGSQVFRNLEKIKNNLLERLR